MNPLNDEVTGLHRHDRVLESERQHRRPADRSHTRQTADLSDRGVEVLLSSPLRIRVRVEPDFRGKHMLDVQAWINRGDMREASKEEGGGDKKHKSKGDLTDN